MNFDKLKNEWNADHSEENNRITGDMLKIKQAHTPIDIIRKKMKHEFFYQLVALIIMSMFPYIIGFSTEMKLVI